jgi:hypothetical protein
MIESFPEIGSAVGTAVNARVTMLYWKGQVKKQILQKPAVEDPFCRGISGKANCLCTAETIELNIFRLLRYYEEILKIVQQPAA